MEDFTIKVYDKEGKEVEVTKTIVKKPVASKKKEKTFLEEMVSPRSDVSSKRVIGALLILVIVASYVLDSLAIIKINTEMGIYIFGGGIILLVGTVAEKFAKPKPFIDPNNLMKDDSNPTIVN